MSELERLNTLIFLLQKEAKALRSVLSEFEGDKFEFTQMHAANDFRAAIEQLLYRKELK